MDLIATHANADFDCLGAMIAARYLYPDAVLMFPGGQERGLRDFLLQSSLYAYNVKRFRDIDLDQVTRLILVDVRSAARIGPLAELLERDGVVLHIYDHHPGGDDALSSEQGVIEDIGATTSIMAHLLMERGIVPTPEEATMMMLGIYEDTGNLLYSSTRTRDYQAAAWLLERGANLNTVSDFLVRELTSEQVELLNVLLKSCQKLLFNGIEIAIASASVDDYIGDISTLVHKLKDIENLDALIVAVRMEDRIFLIGRSRLPEFDVGELFREFGGGGHAFAASATVRDIPLVQLLERIEAALGRHVRPRFDARSLMSSPVKTLDVDADVESARVLMTRFNFNAVPVLDQQQRVVGILNRQLVEKAAHHRLAKICVAELMNSDFGTAPPDAGVNELQQGIIEHNQRCIPIVENDRLVGVVTRTDLLRHLLGQRQLGEETGALPGLSGLQIKRKNLARLLESQLSKRLEELLLRFSRVAEEAGVRIYLVGGCVRDLLLRTENLDIDIVVVGDGINFARRFARSCDCRVREHDKFATAVIVFADGFKVDIASARLEYYERPAALPRVEHASLRHDLYRRDFTINTLTISLNRDNYGQLLDFFGGQRDLKERSIRILHNLSFVEDPTRLFRAVRFEQRLGFSIGRQTERLMHSAIRLNLVGKLGGARIFHELRLILGESEVVGALKRLHQFDLLRFIDPRLRFDGKTEALLRKAEQVCSWFDLLFTGEDYRRWRVYLLCLLDQLTVKGMQRAVSWLMLPTREQSQLQRQRQRCRTLLQFFAGYHKGARPLNSEIYHSFEGFDLEVLLYLMARVEEPPWRQWISLYVTELRKKKPLLGGRDLIALGYVPGRRFQKMQTTLLDARLNGLVHTRDDEVALIRRQFDLLQGGADS
jgi:tRNA nucleotidyltransferase (CCA-adding enzyme)